MRYVLSLLCGLFFMGQISSASAADMKLMSTDIAEGTTLSNAHVFNGFGCAGENISPQLSWSGVPKNAKSLAISMYDPDAPTGSGWWHWLAFNIPVSVNEIASGASLSAMPEGVIESRTDYAKTGFGGACPPEGDDPHRYIITLHALDVETLPLDENAPGAMVGYFLGAHGIAKASITATYGR